MHNPPPLKPSDIMLFVIGLGSVLLMFYAMSLWGKHSGGEGDHGGCGYPILGYLFVIILVLIGVALLSGFQAIYPGQ